ncbi:hypothetical protein SOPP22_12060 [Shewanella sp. OPT22]|nr:hypothetical protein SOPP22_12060 [Shewanella sp. OPT22]
MYKEITIDPECLSDYSYFTLLKTGFGFEKGRYLSVPLKQWTNEAFRAVKASDITDVKQKSVKHFLNKLKKGDIPDLVVVADDRREITTSQQEQWQTWYPLQEGHRLFAAKFKEPAEHGFICYEDVLEDHDKWRIPPSVQVLKTKIDIIKAIKPILAISSDVTIIDQYFKFGSNPVLLTILSLCATYEIKSIRIVTSIETANPQDVFIREYRGLIADLPSIELIVIPNKFIHDRYLITDSAAIKSGHGFGEEPLKNAPSDYTSLSLVSKEERLKVIKSTERYLHDNPQAMMQFN